MINPPVLKKIEIKISPAKVFFTLSLFFGTLFLFLTPPFQSPDEISHFFRAYQISEGQFIGLKQDNRLGGYIPASIIKISQPFAYLRGNMNSRTNFKNIIEQIKIPLEADKKVFIDFPNNALYPPVPYLLQAFIIGILAKLNVPPLIIFYSARLFTLLAWTFSIFYVLKILPHSKWLFTFLALLPMSLFINMSVHADVVTNILSFVVIAYILRCAYLDKTFNNKNLIVISVLLFLLASSKLVYAPLVFLFLLIDPDKFSSRKSYFFQFAFLVIIAFGTVLLWAKKMNGMYTPYSQYNPDFRDGIDLIKGADMNLQIDYILTHGPYIFYVFIHSMIKTFNMYYVSYIGNFGWLDTKLSGWLVFTIYNVILFVAITDSHYPVKIKLIHKLFFVLIILTILFLILLSQHLTWDGVGSDVIGTIQGRYFIPIFPLLFLLFYHSKPYKMIFVSFSVIFFSVFALSVSAYKLYDRYYVIPDFESKTIYCDAETIREENYFKTSIDAISVENANTQSALRSRSGKFSAMLCPGHPYGMTCRFYDGMMGDVIHVEAWRWGSSGGIVFSGNFNQDFYFSNSQPDGTDSLGWQRLVINFTLPYDMSGKEIGIYLHNNNKDTSWFDDIKIEYHTLK